MPGWMDRLTQWQTLFSMTGGMYRRVAGIDVDESAVVSVQLRRTLSEIRVLAADVASLPTGVVVEDAIVNAPVFAATVKTLLARMPTAKQASIALPGSKVVVKQIPLEKKLSDDAAETMAWQEAKRTFPELAKSLMLDFVQVPGALILIVARKEDITPRVEAFQQAGIVTKIVDVDYYALERAYRLFASQLPAGHESQYIGVIDFNPRNLLFIVIHQQKMVYCTRHIYASKIFTPLVHTALQQQSISCVSDEEQSQIVLAIRHLFQSFYTAHAGKIITSIAITGRCALLTETMTVLKGALGMPMIIPDPFASCHFHHPFAPAFVLGCGLALRGV